MAKRSGPDRITRDARLAAQGVSAESIRALERLGWIREYPQDIPDMATASPGARPGDGSGSGYAEGGPVERLPGQQRRTGTAPIVSLDTAGDGNDATIPFATESPLFDVAGQEPPANPQTGPASGAPGSSEPYYDPMTGVGYTAQPPNPVGHGASGSFDEGTDTTSTGAPEAGKTLPVGLPTGSDSGFSFRAGMPGAGNAEIPGSPKLGVPDYTAEADAQKRIAGTEAAGQAEQARVGMEGYDAMRKQDAAWQATQTQYQGAIAKAREAASRSPVQDWSVGHKVLGAVAMALGSFGSALSKTPNYAMALLDKQIDEEVRGRQTALASLTQELGNAQSAHLAMRASLIENLRLDLQARAARSQSDAQKQRIGLIDTQLANKQTEAQNQILLQTHQMNLQRAQIQVEQEKVGATYAARAWEMQKGHVNGIGTFANEKDAEKAADFQKARIAMEPNIRLLEQTWKDRAVGEMPVGPEAEKARQASAALIFGLKDIMGVQRFAEYDVPFFEKLANGDPSVFKRGDTVRASLAGLRRILGDHAAGFRALALMPEDDDGNPLGPRGRTGGATTVGAPGGGTAQASHYGGRTVRPAPGSREKP